MPSTPFKDDLFMEVPFLYLVKCGVCEPWLNKPGNVVEALSLN
jgi:hypothetical protein